MTGMHLIKSRRGLMARIAAALDIEDSAVSHWKRVPAERVPAVSRITGIPRHMLRPDLWDEPSAWEPPDDGNGTRELGAWLRAR